MENNFQITCPAGNKINIFQISPKWPLCVRHIILIIIKNCIKINEENKILIFFKMLMN